MSVKLSQIPFVRILIPFAFGIVAELYFPNSHSIFYFTLLSLCLIFLWNLWQKTKGAEYPLRWVYGVLAAFFLFLSGYSTTLLHTPSESKTFIGQLCSDGEDSMLISIASIPQGKQKTYKTVGIIKGVIKKGQLIHTTGKALFYFHKDSISEKLNYGDELLVYSKLNVIEAPKNPDEFNYKQFLQNRGIIYECYTSGYSYSVIKNNTSNSILQFANNSRKKLILLLQEKIGGSEAELASAILLGYRDELTPSITQSFIDSGVVHVICVAGLHVGIIFLLLSYLIVFPEKFKHGELMSTLLILILLWLYALFTGLAAPVLRATIMLSFFTIGRHYRKYTNTINTLVASAFIMLLFDPFSIADSGFQMSYLAVLGIIVIYKPLVGILSIENLILRKIWELLCVSTAAQVAVFPLSIFYFHQFPNYFIIANILIVPLLVLIIWTGVLFFLLSWIPYLSLAVSWLLKKSLLLMNLIVSGVAHLPFSVTKGISINVFEVLILFLSIICIVYYFSSRKYYALFYGLSVLALFLSIESVKKTVHANQQLFAVYNIPGKTATAFISGTKSVMPFSKIDSSDIAMHLQNNWWALGLKNNQRIITDTDAELLSGRVLFLKQFVQFNNSKIVFIRRNTDVVPVNSDLNFLVVSAGYALDMHTLKNAFTFDTVIFDSSVPDYKLKKWEAECTELNIHFYSVKEQGAFIKNC